ncbi:MAG: DNA repair protein RecO [Actinobacteria bacterium]|nr:DNA repair protein RecO [Actinomycetota bacterium]
MSSYKTEAIVLKSYNLGEADKILKLFSNDKGLLNAVAKGARKIKSKFGGRLELFNVLELEISAGRNLDIINQAELKKNFSLIPSDFNKFIFAQFICEVVLKTHFSEAEMSPVIFKLLCACLKSIDSSKEKDINELQKISVFFIAKFLKITGYPPLIYSCSVCGKKIKPQSFTVYPANKKNSNIYFSIRLGGILCENCEKNIKNITDMKKMIDFKSYDFLCTLFNEKMKICMESHISSVELDEIFGLLEEYLKYHYDLSINTAVYLKSIKE